ncbi:MAG: hypothetical protein G01um10148_734 [Parcubacteria group bacterium Gr01-1014_8]|nr:MAG: hypothetical protein G01um10148_734 [Parcubacteria group bacterium Gr01-1014_8]
MAKKIVTFIATQYKDKPVTVSFYTKEGEKVKFTATEKTPVKTPVSFRAKR